MYPFYPMTMKDYAQSTHVINLLSRMHCLLSWLFTSLHIFYFFFILQTLWLFLPFPFAFTIFLFTSEHIIYIMIWYVHYIIYCAVIYKYHILSADQRLLSDEQSKKKNPERRLCQRKNLILSTGTMI